MEAAYAETLHVQETPTMLRREPSHDPATVSDTELGVAALLLLIVVVLAVAIVPTFA